MTDLKIKPTVLAVVPCAFAVVPFAKFQYKFTFFLIEVPLTREKLLCPIKREVLLSGFMDIIAVV